MTRSPSWGAGFGIGTTTAWRYVTRDGGIAAAAGPMYMDSAAGYAATGRWFRYVTTTLAVPAESPSETGSMAQVMLATSGGASMALQVIPGGGPDSVTYGGTGLGVHALNLSPAAGHSLTISVLYDQHGHVRFTATNNRTGRAPPIRALTTLASLRDGAARHPRLRSCLVKFGTDREDGEERCSTVAPSRPLVAYPRVGVTFRTGSRPLCQLLALTASALDRWGNGEEYRCCLSCGAGIWGSDGDEIGRADPGIFPTRGQIRSDWPPGLIEPPEGVNYHG